MVGVVFEVEAGLVVVGKKSSNAPSVRSSAVGRGTRKLGRSAWSNPAGSRSDATVS